MADQVITRLRAMGHRFADRHLAYAGAGHLISFPYGPTTQLSFGGLELGGNPSDTALANRDAWPKVLHFLHRHLGAMERAGSSTARGPSS